MHDPAKSQTPRAGSATYPTKHYAVVRIQGVPIWSCNHEHIGSAAARQCAQDRIDEMKAQGKLASDD